MGKLKSRELLECYTIRRAVTGGGGHRTLDPTALSGRGTLPVGVDALDTRDFDLVIRILDRERS